MRRLVAFMVVVLLTAAPLTAQTAFKVKVDGDKNMKGQRIIIPTVLLHVTTHGKLFSVQGNASAKGKYFVSGVDRDRLVEIARGIEDDLAAKYAAAGYEVLRYSDIKDDPSITKQKREQIDDKYGLPTHGERAGNNNFVLVTASPEQAFNSPLGGYYKVFKDIAKGRDALVIVPELQVVAPLMSKDNRRGYKSNSAGITITPDMGVEWAAAYFINAKQAGGLLRAEADWGWAEEIGELMDSKDESPEFANGLGDALTELTGYGSLNKKAKAWVMKAKPDAYYAAIARAGQALNDGIVASTKKQ